MDLILGVGFPNGEPSKWKLWHPSGPVDHSPRLEYTLLSSQLDYFSPKNSDDDEVDYSIKPEFYDPNLDNKDESWVRKKRKGCISDAMLSCPACFTTLCLDCQRHEKYVTQFRAMFVVNCKINEHQILREQKRKPRRGKSFNDSKQIEKDAVFRPVCCSVCSTEVGVFDEDEVYHFFNVIPSEP